MHYAHELAKKGMNLVLVARKAALLNEIADDIKSKYAVKVDVIIADFGKGIDIFMNIEESLADKDIGILVNNVGVAYDRLKYFHEDSEENMWNMINVNISKEERGNHKYFFSRSNRQSYTSQVL